MNFKLSDNMLNAEDFNRLRMANGFMERPLEQVEKALEGGVFNVIACSDGKTVGMGRLVGDGFMYWYLQDIVVLPEYQGMGIGRAVVNRLLEYVRNASLPDTKVNVGLTALKGKDTFYEKFGFHSNPTENCGPGMGMQIDTTASACFASR